jgi:hypothetical protein
VTRHVIAAHLRCATLPGARGLVRVRARARARVRVRVRVGSGSGLDLSPNPNPNPTQAPRYPPLAMRTRAVRAPCCPWRCARCGCSA